MKSYIFAAGTLIAAAYAQDASVRLLSSRFHPPANC